jgi:hypothetical protein
MGRYPGAIRYLPMARYRIVKDRSALSVEVTDVAGHQEQLLQAFGECQAGRCSCPTDEYQKMLSMELEQTEDRVRLRLEAKPGEEFDTSEIAACLEYTTANLSNRPAE